MSWIQTDYDFGYPFVVFTIGVRQIAQCVEVRDILKSNAGSPEMIEELVQKIIEFRRPNLKGGRVVGIRLTGGLMWEIEYAHPDLPRMKRGDMPVRWSLVPDEEVRVGQAQVMDEPLNPDIHARIAECEPDPSWSVEPKVYEDNKGKVLYDTVKKRIVAQWCTKTGEWVRPVTERIWGGPVNDPNIKMVDLETMGKIVEVGKGGLCKCDCGMVCPLGKTGMEVRCSERELQKAGVSTIRVE